MSEVGYEDNLKKKFKFEKMLVAEIDVLGIKNSLNEEYAVDILRALHDEFSYAKEDAESLDSEYCVIHKHHYKIFSDNIAIAVGCMGEWEIGIKLNNLANAIARLQAKLWHRHGLILRGGIAFGDCFVDDIMILGQGLVDAYKLESEISIYPRVILNPDLNKYTNLLNKKDFEKDCDGFYYVDYISLWNKRIDLTDKKKDIEILRRRIGESKDQRVIQKYRWLLEKAEIAAQ